MYFSDLHVQLVSRSLLEPGEQLVGQTVTDYLPFWAFGLINRQYLVLATDQRIIIVDHRLSFFPIGQRMHAVQSIPWSNVQEARVTGIFKKKLRIRGLSDHGPVKMKAKISNALFGLLAPMKNNMQGARAVAAAQANRALAAAPQAPQFGMAPAPQLPAQAFAMPAQNAPGYHSVPPPAPSPYGAAPQSFGPPSMPPGYPPRAS